MKKLLFITASALLVFASCGTVQSIIKSSFPYTANLVIPASSTIGTMHTAMSTATSFDQNFAKDGNTGSRISEVRIVSAKMQATLPADFNIGNLVSAKIYMAKADGRDEVLVASRSDITANAGNNITLDIDNTNFLDELVREPKVRIRMTYELRSKIAIDANLKIVLGISANPAR